MRYALFGNAPIEDPMIVANWADRVTQLNTCRHLGKIGLEKTNQIVITNTGPPAREIQDSVCAAIPMEKRKDVTIWLARNEVFSHKKMQTLKARGNRFHTKFAVGTRVGDFDPSFVVREMPLDLTSKMEADLIGDGMPEGSQPSTGFVAFYHLLSQMGAGDELALVGFTHKGWYGHPWAIEEKWLKPYLWSDQRAQTS